MLTLIWPTNYLLYTIYHYDQRHSKNNICEVFADKWRCNILFESNFHLIFRTNSLVSVAILFNRRAPAEVSFYTFLCVKTISTVSSPARELIKCVIWYLNVYSRYGNWFNFISKETDCKLLIPRVHPCVFLRSRLFSDPGIMRLVKFTTWAGQVLNVTRHARKYTQAALLLFVWQVTRFDNNIVKPSYLVYCQHIMLWKKTIMTNYRRQINYIAFVVYRAGSGMTIN